MTQPVATTSINLGGAMHKQNSAMARPAQGQNTKV